MSYVAPDPNAFMGTSVGNGQCVDYVKQAAGCPASSNWTNGVSLRGAEIPVGTAIATFQNGVYGNYTDGRSHAAIYIGQNQIGLVVHDQWKGQVVQVVHQRTIRFQNGAADPRNDGDAFSVIENMAVIAAITRERKRTVPSKTKRTPTKTSLKRKRTIAPKAKRRSTK